MAKIHEIRITKLFGRFDVQIPIRDNRIVLVGVNGLGKTTIVNLLYFLLTKQWRRLHEHDFEAIAIDLGAETVSVSRSEMDAATAHQRLLRREFLGILPARAIRKLQVRPDLVDAVLSRDARQLRNVSEELGVPLAALREIGNEIAHRPRQMWQRALFEDNTLQRAISQIDANIDGQVLYLPTYRRIERDLQSLMPNPGTSQSEQSRLTSRTSDGFIEFVEFGMQDVELSYQRALVRLKETARVELNRLAGTYLREVINGQGESYDRDVIAKLDETTVRRILGRVGERDDALLLPEPERDQLLRVIQRIKRSEDANLSATERYIAHFFMKLVEIHSALSAQESAISTAVRVCNKYLEGKTLAFDESNYAVRVVLESGETIRFADLSSGEKQIVSLFTHIYVGTEKSLYVIIDEPELSLSIEWQKRLLPDLLNSQRTAFLVAVTHSPFIFQNEMDEYAVDLRRLIHPAKHVEQ